MMLIFILKNGLVVWFNKYRDFTNFKMYLLKVDSLWWHTSLT